MSKKRRRNRRNDPSGLRSAGRRPGPLAGRLSACLLSTALAEAKPGGAACL
jgi:hypothetical protein